MIPDEIYHYTKRETALEKILFDKTIRLGQIGSTNDPRESKERQFATIQGFRIPKGKYLKILGEADRIVKKEWKVFCASQHSPDYNQYTGEISYPFCRGDCRPRMWATYAENHRGVCLKFNGNKFAERLKEELGSRCKIFCGPVIYDDLEAIASSTIDLGDDDKLDLKEAVRDYFKRSGQKLFLQKSKDWETEYEYRWLVHSSKDAPEYVSIDGVIEGVLVGSDFPKVYFPSLVELCKELKIPAGIIEWHNGLPRSYYGRIYQP